MIVGIGTDIARIDRIAGTLERFGDRFLARVFTEIEQAKSEPRMQRAASYAKRWAAKEACSKALGSGIRMGVNWREMEVVNLHTGQPTMRLHGGASARARAMMPEGHEPRLHVTLTDDDPYAMAVVVLEAVGPGAPSLPDVGAWR